MTDRPAIGDYLLHAPSHSSYTATPLGLVGPRLAVREKRLDRDLDL